MKNNFFFYLFPVLIFVCIFISAENPNRIYFKISPENRQIVLPVQLNDSITVDMAFDSGAGAGVFILDSTFCATHPNVTLNVLPDTIGRGGSSWSSKAVSISIYKTAPSVKIGYTDLKYNYMMIYNWNKYYNTSDSKGMFNIPKNDTTHVWELNFEYNYLEIHQAVAFKMPENCLVFPMIKDKSTPAPFNIQLPIKIKCVDGDTLTLNRKFLVDAGMPEDIALLYRAEELAFFNKKNDAVWTENQSSYNRYYTVNATLFDNFAVDSLRIYTFDHPNSISSNYLIGQNFLKRFNVFFDLKNSKIGLQPIKHFQRVINPNHRRFHFSTDTTPKGKSIVTMVANYKGNFYKTAGLRVGDEIVSLNGKLYKNITYEEKSEFYKEATLVFNIIRKGKPLKIIVRVDKNEVQGD